MFFPKDIFRAVPRMVFYARTPSKMAMPKVILIAGGSPNDIDAVEQTLKHVNVRNAVRSVYDGTEVITYLKGEGAYANRAVHPYPVLLLLDLKMPQVSGLDVLRWIRVNPGRPQLGVVMLTAADNVRELSQAYQLGAQSFLVTPLASEEFLNTLASLKGMRLESSGEGPYLDFDATIFPRAAPADLRCLQKK